MGRTLYFEGVGSNTKESRDMESCRVRTAFYNNEGKAIYLELLEGDKIDVRNHHKVTGRKLKHEIITRTPGYMWVDFCHYITPDKDDCNESAIRDINGKRVERNKVEVEYTKASVLEWINTTLNCSFTDIKVLPRFSGYYVFDKEKALYGKCYMMDDYIDIPKRTEARHNIYYNIAKDYFNAIYDRHIKENPKAAYLKSKYESWSLVSMDDNTMTIRSHTYKELIDDSERVKVFEVAY